MIKLVDLVICEKRHTQADWREGGLNLRIPKSKGGFFDGNLYHFTTYAGLQLMLKTGRLSFTPGAVLNQYDILGNSQDPRYLIKYNKGKWNSEVERLWNTYYISTTTNGNFWGGFPGLEHIRPRQSRKGNNPFYKEGSQNTSFRNDLKYLEYLKAGDWKQTEGESPIISPESWRMVRLTFDVKSLEKDFIVQWNDFHLRAEFDQEVRIHPNLAEDGRPVEYSIPLQKYVTGVSIIITSDSKATFEQTLSKEKIPSDCIVDLSKEGSWMDFYNPDDKALQGNCKEIGKSTRDSNFSWGNENIPLVLNNSERNSLVEGIAATLFCLNSLHSNFDYKNALGRIEEILSYKCEDSTDRQTIREIIRDISRWIAKMRNEQFDLEDSKSEWEIKSVEQNLERIRSSLKTGGKSFIQRKLKDTSTNAAGLIHKRTHNSLLADNTLRSIEYLEDLVKKYGYSSFTALVKAWISQSKGKGLAESFNLRTYLQNNWLLLES